MRKTRYSALTLALALPLALAVVVVPAVAGVRTTSAIATDSMVYIERIAPDSSRRLEPASHLSRGDRVVTVLRWHGTGRGSGFVITNPLPASLAFQGSTSDGQEVSVDGGRSWGRLDAMRIGGRDAVPEDVTHVRWRIPAARAATGSGQIAYSGIVR